MLRGGSFLNRHIGILGGMGPESTMIYYRYITREYTKRYGALNYPEIVIYSLRYQELACWLHEERWDLIVQTMTKGFRALHRATADFGLIACNTLHIVFDEAQSKSPIPLINIIDATAEAIEQECMRTVGLLGTALTMNRDFYKKTLAKKNINVLVPKKEDQLFVDKAICEELVQGIIRTKSKKRLIKIIHDIVSRGAEGVVLGCTELPLLVNEQDCEVQLFDTALIHSKKALDFGAT